MPNKKNQRSYEHGISEAQFQARVIGLARRAGFGLADGGPKGTPLDLIYHTFDSRRCAPGFPDLCLLKPGEDLQAAKTARLIFAELKKEAGRLTPQQNTWLSALRSVGPPVEVYVWRPSDWESIKRILGGPDNKLFL